jgi:hypothetical protein
MPRGVRNVKSGPLQNVSYVRVSNKLPKNEQVALVQKALGTRRRKFSTFGMVHTDKYRITPTTKFVKGSLRATNVQGIPNLVAYVGHPKPKSHLKF